MILNILNGQYPFSLINAASTSTKIVMVKRRHQLDLSSHSVHLLHKITKLTQLPLPSLLSIRFVKEEEGWVDLYYESVSLKLEQVLVEMDTQQVKHLHRQFIDLAISLAKVGIITTFDGKRCGCLKEDNKNSIKYYLEPDRLTLTGDLKVIEEEVMKFCAQAMEFIKEVLTHSEHILAASTSQKYLTSSIEKKQDPSCQEKLFQSKYSGKSHLKIASKVAKESSLRKLSVLSRELSEISARHRGMKGFLPTQRKISFSQQKKSDITCNTNEHESQSSTLEIGSSQSIPTPLLFARSKRAQHQLSQISERVQPYKQIYNILKNMHVK